jgi:hypothetical protein
MPNTAAQFLDENGKQLLASITLCEEKFYAAVLYQRWFPAREALMYGKRISFGTYFKTRKKEFTEVVITRYTKKQPVKYLCLDLWWKPVKKRLSSYSLE